MRDKYFKLLKTAITFSVAMFILCGLIYPLAITGISQIVFANQANGSLVYKDGKAVGSAVVGQTFEDKRFMRSRPSAVNYNVYTAAEKEAEDYTGIATGSKNYAPTNPDLKDRVQEDITKFLADNPSAKLGEIPADLLTASGSGLDPHISPASAQIQLATLSANTGLSVPTLEEIVKRNTKGKFIGVFGEPTVNVLGVNMDIATALKL